MQINKTKASISNNNYFVYGGLVIILLLFVFNYSANIWLEHNYGAVNYEYLAACDLTEIPHMRAPLKAWFLCLSVTVFDNEHVVPFLFSFGLLPLTFMLVRQITKNNIAALFSTALLLTSNIVGLLGTTAALSADWAFFLILSLLVSYKRPELAGVFFFAAIATKGLSLLLLPVIIYFIWKSNNPNKKKAIISYAVAGLVAISFWSMGFYTLIQEDGQRWNPENFDKGIRDMWFVFRHDPLQWLILPVAIIILCQSRIKESKGLLLMIGWFWSLNFLLPIFSMYEMFDYRMIPLIVFASVACGFFIRSNAPEISNQSPE